MSGGQSGNWPRGGAPNPRLSVWPTGQIDLAGQQRASGCAPGTETDVDQIPPAIAAHAIDAYSRAGELVVDPACGCGTVLIEALRAGRHAVGLTTDRRQWTVARANVTAAKRNGAWCDGSVFDAPPKALRNARAAGLIGRAALVLTALRLPSRNDSGDKDHWLHEALDDLAVTLTYCTPLIQPGGQICVVARPLRHLNGELVDLTTYMIGAGTAAGLVPVERCVALTAEIRGTSVKTRASFAERQAATASRAAGQPVMLAAHYEVIVYKAARDAGNSAAVAAAPPATRAGTLRRFRAERAGRRAVA